MTQTYSVMVSFLKASFKLTQNLTKYFALDSVQTPLDLKKQNFSLLTHNECYWCLFQVSNTPRYWVFIDQRMYTGLDK